MSEGNTYPIRCPQCEKEQESWLYDSVNVQRNPELKKDLLTNELNKVTCEACSFVFRVDKPLLYHDPESRVLIYWIPTPYQEHPAGQDELRGTVADVNKMLPDEIKPPDLHLVYHRTELVERIFLLEADFDERVIEYVKHMMYTKNLKRLDPHNKNLLFNVQDSNEESLFFVIQDIETSKLEGMLQFQRKTYNALVEMFDQDEKTAHLLELFPGPYISARALLLDEQEKSNSIS